MVTTIIKKTCHIFMSTLISDHVVELPEKSSELVTLYVVFIRVNIPNLPSHS